MPPCRFIPQSIHVLYSIDKFGCYTRSCCFVKILTAASQDSSVPPFITQRHSRHLEAPHSDRPDRHCRLPLDRKIIGRSRSAATCSTPSRRGRTAAAAGWTRPARAGARCSGIDGRTRLGSYRRRCGTVGQPYVPRHRLPVAHRCLHGCIYSTIILSTQEAIISEY